MNLETARSTLMGAVEAVIAGMSPVPAVEWPNREQIDKAQQVAPFICVDYVVGDGLQKSLGDSNRVVRYFGVLTLLVHVKVGSGLAVATGMMDVLVTGLSMKNFSGLQLEEAKPRRGVPKDGWHTLPLTVPFYFDDLL